MEARRGNVYATVTITDLLEEGGGIVALNTYGRKWVPIFGSDPNYNWIWYVKNSCHVQT